MYFWGKIKGKGSRAKRRKYSVPTMILFYRFFTQPRPTSKLTAGFRLLSVLAFLFFIPLSHAEKVVDASLETPPTSFCQVVFGSGKKMYQHAKAILGIPLSIRANGYASTFDDLMNRYGTTIRVPTGATNYHLTSDLGMSSTVLLETGNNKTFSKMPFPTHSSSFVLGSDSVFNLNGQVWETQIKALRPHLFQENLERSGTNAIVEKHLQSMMKQFDESARTAPSGTTQVNVSSTFGNFALRNISEGLFGLQFSENDLTLLRSSLKTIFKNFQKESTEIFYLGRLLTHFVPRDAQGKEAKKTLQKFVAKMVADIRARDPSLNPPFLAALLEQKGKSGKVLNDDELSQQVLFFYSAGLDTTEALLTTSLHQILKSTPTKDAIEKQIEGIPGEGFLMPGQIQKGAALIDHAVEEAARLEPPVYLYRRIAEKNTKLTDSSGKTHDIKKGDQMILYPRYGQRRTPWGISKDGSNKQPDLDTFVPERMSPEFTRIHDVLKKSMGNFLFGNGPRICPGRFLAMSQIRGFLGNLFKNFHVDSANPAAGDDFTSNLTLHLSKPLIINIKPKPRVRTL